MYYKKTTDTCSECERIVKKKHESLFRRAEGMIPVVIALPYAAGRQC